MKNLTSEDFKTAAIKLCELRKIEPFEFVQDPSNNTLANVKTQRWCVVSRELEKFAQNFQVLNSVTNHEVQD